MYLKKIIISVLAILSASMSHAVDTVKFAFLAPDTLNPANAAIFNGACDALKELESRFNKKFKMEYVSAQGSGRIQLGQLGNLYLENFSGAMVSPVFGNSKALEKEIVRMKTVGFYCILLGELSEGDSYIGSVSTDRQKFAEEIRKEMKRLSGKSAPSLMCYMWSKSQPKTISESEMNPETLDGLLYPSLKYSDFLAIVSGYKIQKVEELEFYSLYSEINAVSLKRLDNYAEIFFNPMLLANPSPIKKDTDRIFSICIGALPQLDYYLSANMLDSCIFDDYYGWGYFSARALAEKIGDGNNPSEKNRLLKPLVATPKNVDKFKSDWKLWLK